MEKSFQVTVLLPVVNEQPATMPVVSSSLTFWTRGRSTPSQSSSSSSSSSSTSETYGQISFTESTLDFAFLQEKISLDLSTIVVIDLLAKSRPLKNSKLREGIEIEGPECKIVLFSSRAEKGLFLSILTTKLRDKIADQLEPYWLHHHIRGTLFSAVVNSSSANEKEFRELCAYSISGRGRSDSDDHDPLTDAGEHDDTPPRFDINMIDEDSGKTALHVASSLKSPAVARLYTQILLEHGASSSNTDHDFQTPLHSSAAALNADVVTLLLANGAQVDARDLLEQTPLELVLQALSNTTLDEEKSTLAESVVKILLSYGASVNEADGEGLFPLHRVAKTQRPLLLRALQKRGVNPQMRVNGDKELLTALHIACGAEVDKSNDGRFVLSSTMIQALLSLGCPVNAPTSSFGSTPLHLVLDHLKTSKLASNLEAIHESERAALYLCLHGARLNIPDKKGVDGMILSKELELVEVLETACNTFLESMPPLSAHAALPSMDATYLEMAQFNDFGGDFRKSVLKGERSHVEVKLQDDASRSTCNGCELPFNQLSRRKHHCRRCGLLMCSSCTSKKLKRSATSGDSDDEEITAVNAFSLMKSLFTPPPPTTGQTKLVGIRVCDNCFNLCCAFSLQAAADKEEWEKQRLEAASRNMTEAPSHADQRLALLGKGGKGRGKGDPKVHELNDVLDKNKNLLLERGQKLSRLDEKVLEMNQHAKSFADNAELIKKRAKNGWF